MHRDDVEIKKSDCMYSGVFQIHRLTLRFRQYSGEWSDWIEREQVCRHDAVAVLLYDPSCDKIILVEQLRIGALRQDNTESPWMVEIVAGLCDHDESLSMTAKREAQEEADCEIQSLFPILSFYPTPGGFTEKTHIYCGTVDSNKVGKLCGNPDEHEDISVKVIAAASVLNDLKSGKLVTSASSVIALMWLEAKRNTPEWRWDQGEQ